MNPKILVITLHNVVKNITIPNLVSLLRQEFLTIKKYDNYAKLIKVFYSLGAIDRANAIPPRKIKVHGISQYVITQCSTNYDILKTVSGGSRFPLIITERVGVKWIMAN